MWYCHQWKLGSMWCFHKPRKACGGYVVLSQVKAGKYMFSSQTEGSARLLCVASVGSVSLPVYCGEYVVLSQVKAGKNVITSHVFW